MRKVTLSTKLIAGGLVIALIPLITIGVFTVISASKAMDDLEREQLVNLKKAAINLLNTNLTGQTNLLMNASTRDSLIQTIIEVVGETGILEMAQFHLDEKTTIFHNKKEYEIFFITDQKGEIIGDTSGGIYRNTSLSGEEYFKRAIKGETVIGKVVKAEKSGQEYVVTASPMKKKDDEIIGIIVSGWKMDYINQIIGDMKLGKTGYAFLVDKDGMIIAHPDKEMFMQVNIMQVKGMERAAERMISFDEGIEECIHEGQDKVVAFSPIKISDWSLGLIIPKSEYMAPIERMRTIIFLTGLVILGVVSLVLLWAIRRLITKPINHIVENLTQGANQVASASAQVSASSQSLAEGASEQASSLEETSSSLEEMASMTKQNADNATQADALMKESNQVVSRANQSMQNLTTSMEEISKASEETSKIIKTIDEIAFQTNLLALNAAVEAARAGEAGAGFAVVADEVRNLAMRAADAARNTSDLIEGTVKKVKDGADMVKTTNDAFSEVSTNASKVGELVGEIAAASQEQASGIEQVNKAVAEMDKVVQQTAANAEESASASEQMNAQAEQMKGTVGNLIVLVSGERGRAEARKYEGREAGTTAPRRPASGNRKKIAAQGEKAIHKETAPEERIPMEEGEFKDF